MKKRTENLLIVIILFSGFILRFLSSAFHSYSSDELSAITRLQYDSFSELIEFGVKIGDMHPAGVQLFMKLWSVFFGTSEAIMRLPFVLLGTASIYFIYKIGKRYSTETGLFASAFWAVLLFPIIQSELARPYSPGLFFTLLASLFILKFVFDPLTIKQKWLNSIGLAFAISACMYAHYFAFLTVGFMAVTALFFLKKNVLLPYIVAGILSILLFLPHLSITIYQTSVDGGLQWLAPPDNWWLFHFLYHAFNNSWLLITILTISLAIAIWTNFKSGKISVSKLNIILAIWFFGIYIVGNLLSHYLTPILKYPVMLFVFPFFTLLITNTLNRLFAIAKSALPIALIALVLLSTTIEKRLFDNVHYEVFKELSEHIRSWEKKANANNMTIAMNISNPYYLNYYALQTGEEHVLDLDIINYADAPRLDSVLKNSNNSYFVLGYSARHTPIQFLNQSLQYFPYISDYYQYNNSAIFLLSKKPENQSIEFTSIQSISFAESKENWEYEKLKFDGNKHIYYADSLNIYRPQFILPINNKFASNKQFIKVELTANIEAKNQITLVAIPETTDNMPVADNYGNPIWLGLNIEQSLLRSGKGSFAFSLPPNMPADGHLKIYIWNRNKKPFIIKNVEIKVLKNIWNN